MTVRIIHKVSAFFIGMSIAFMLYFAYIYSDYEYEKFKPVSWIFQSSVAVPSFVEGENPLVAYNRSIHEDFRATPLVEIKTTDDITVCRTDLPKEYSYEKDETLDPNKVTLEWYVEAPCVHDLTPGQYYLTTDYVIKRVGEPDRHLRVVSNVFEVKPQNTP